MKEPAENIYSSDGRILNEISHEKERVIELSISLSLGNVQDAVKRAFRDVRKEMIPLYVTASVEQLDADRIHSQRYVTVWKWSAHDTDAWHV